MKSFLARCYLNVDAQVMHDGWGRSMVQSSVIGCIKGWCNGPTFTDRLDVALRITVLERYIVTLHYTTSTGGPELLCALAGLLAFR